MDDEINFLSEKYPTPFSEGLPNIQLPEQQVYSYAGFENVSLPNQHAFPRETFLTTNQFCMQATPSGVPNYSTPTFTGHGEGWNISGLAEQSGVIQSFPDCATNQLQGQNQFSQHCHSSKVQASSMYFPFEQRVSEMITAIPSTPGTVYVDPRAPVVYDPNSFPKLSDPYQIHVSNVDVRNIGQRYFENPDGMQCPVSEITTDSAQECDQNKTSGFNDIYAQEGSLRQDSAGTGFDSRSLGNLPIGNAACSSLIPTNPKNIETPATSSGSNNGQRADNHNHGPSARSFLCTVCGKVYTRRDALIRHQKEKHGSKKSVNYSCNYCGKGFLFRCNFETHLRVHTKEKPFKCSVCDRGFTQNSNLKTHVAIHTEKRPFECRLCNRIFKKWFYLRRHENTHHPFKCKKCHRSFISERDLQSHEATDHSEWKFQMAERVKTFRI